MLASADRIVATIHGRGGHASTPHLALDPVPVAAELILALQSMITRRVDVFDPAVLTITRLTGGTTNNIIPASVEIEGTIRTLSEITRASVAPWVHQVADGSPRLTAHGSTWRLVESGPRSRQVLVYAADAATDKPRHVDRTDLLTRARVDASRASAVQSRRNHSDI